MSSVLANAADAMVVGDQASYLGTHVPTADLRALLRKSDSKVEDQIVWRTRRPSTKKKLMKEHALILRKIVH